MVEQRATVDRAQLIEYRGKVDFATFSEINRAIRSCEKLNQNSY